MSLASIFSWDFISLILRLSIPITLAAIGGTFSERSGIINLGLEGMMLMGAFGAVLGSHLMGSPYAGILFAVIFGGLMGLVHAIFCIRFRANQVVIGVGVNIIAGGLTRAMVKAVWGKEGISGSVNQLADITVPVLSRLPLLGGFFRQQSLFLYFSMLVVLGGWFVLYKTKTGLRLRAIGEHPRAAQTAGIPIKRYRYICVTLSGVLAGLGGAYLSIVQNNLFVSGMSAGRGFMALAANIFGGWNPLGAFGASIMFATAQALRLNLADLNIPAQFIQMMPYVLTLIVLISVGRKTKSPEALGKLE